MTLLMQAARLHLELIAGLENNLLNRPNCGSSAFLSPNSRVMWHSQILGSFEAKNITCVFLHDNSNLAIGIPKDVFPDDKKYKKVRKSGLKILFCIF